MRFDPTAEKLLPDLTPRDELVLLARTLWREGYDDHLAGHITIRQDDGTFLCNPWYLLWCELRPEHVIRIDIEGNVVERFAAAGVPVGNISFSRDTYTFRFAGAPSAFVAAFRNYYGPTMNAFAAAEQDGKSADLQQELEALFERENRSGAKDTTSIPATFLKVTVAV